jgi:hypothetical protein
VLLGYALASAINTGPQTSNIAAYQDALGFTTTTGDTVEFTSVSSLDFTVTNPNATPEPSTFLLLFTGLGAGALLMFRRVTA